MRVIVVVCSCSTYGVCVRVCDCVMLCGAHVLRVCLWCVRAYGISVVWTCWWFARAGDVFVMYVWMDEWMDGCPGTMVVDTDLSRKFILHT